MKSISRVAAIFSIAAASAIVPVSASAQALPSASELVAKYVTAIGGAGEVMKIKSLKQIATMDVPAVGLSAKMEMYSAAPNKSSAKTTIVGLGEMLQGYNGTVGWDVNPMAGPKLLEDKALAQRAEGADFYGNMLYGADKYTSMETIGDTTIGGERAYKVKMVSKVTKTESTQIFSATTGLIIGAISSTESQMGVIQSVSTISEYKKFGGVLMATKIEQSVGPQKVIMNVLDVVINGAPEAAFDVPAQIKPLIKP